MNKAKRQSIINLLTKLGYKVTGETYSNRLNHYYKLIKDNVTFNLLLTKDIAHFSFVNNAGKSESAYGLLLEHGDTISHNKQHEHYKTLVDLVWEVRDLLNIEVPTIIL